MKYISGFLQWVHLISAILAVGSTFFMRFILFPAVEKLEGSTADSRQALMVRMLPRLRMTIHISIALLIATGTYRFIRTLDKLSGWAEYHAVFGIKVLLSLAVFVIAIGLTMPPAPTPNVFQRNRSKWLLINFVLAAVVVLLSGYLRRLWDVR